MKIFTKTIIISLLLTSTLFCIAAENPSVIIRTTAGNITVLLDAENAPVTVENFLSYVDSDGYSDSIFHRVIEGFMIQAGGYLANMRELEDREQILNEADNGLKNLTGTIAMARMNEIDTASRQFFINVNDNAFLDHNEQSCTRENERSRREALEKGLHKPKTCKSFGYAVFGKVVGGMEIVRKIEFTPVGSRKGFQNVPVEPITILRIEHAQES